MNLAHLLVRAARVHPERPAVLVGDRPQWTYRELADRTSRLAGHLRDGLGLQPGDRVAVYMTNHVAYLEVLYAAWWAGLAGRRFARGRASVVLGWRRGAALGQSAGAAGMVLLLTLRLARSAPGRVAGAAPRPLATAA